MAANTYILHTVWSMPRSGLFYEFCDIYTLLAYLNSPPLFTIRTDSPKNTSTGKTHINLWFMMRAFFPVIVPILQNDPLLFLSTSWWQSRHTTTQLSRLPSFLPSTWWNSQCLQYQPQYTHFPFCRSIAWSWIVFEKLTLLRSKQVFLILDLQIFISGKVWLNRLLWQTTHTWLCFDNKSE